MLQPSLIWLVSLSFCDLMSQAMALHIRTHQALLFTRSQLSGEYGFALMVVLQAAGITHIGFGPMKKENQDDFYVQVTGFGSCHNAHLWGVFDGHGKYGKQAATYCASNLPKLLDSKLSTFFSQVGLSGQISQTQAPAAFCILHAHITC